MRTAEAFALAMLVVGCGSSGGSSTTPGDSGGDVADVADTVADAREARQLASALARDDLSCTTDADCCVVFDLCINDGYIVSAKDKDKVAALLATADPSDCNFCEPPPTQVSCAATGFCTGVKVDCTGSSLFKDGMKNHCGTLALPAGCAAKTASIGAPGLGPKKVLHCGP
jgi:hypothetical protein